MLPKTCFLCEKEIQIGSRYQIIGLDKPYINLYFHRGCYGLIGEINVFLSQNVKKVYNWCNKTNKNTKK
jgi:hypothetical protein